MNFGRIAAVVLAASLGMVLVAGAGPARAVDYGDAQRLYERGNFRAAAMAAERVGSAETLALAARSRLMRAAYLLPRDQGRAELEVAETLARKALTRDPRNVEALLNLAIALGYRARVGGYVTAYFEGLASEARGLIAAARDAAPESGWVRAVSGAWNAEIALAAGGTLADTLYGASTAAALDDFAAAVRLDPRNPLIRLEYAKVLLKLRGTDGAAAARDQLDAALAAPAPDVASGIMREKAQVLKAALAAADPAAAIKAALDEIDPFALN